MGTNSNFCTTLTKFFLLAHQTEGSGGDYRICSCLSSPSSVVWRQHFQTTSPLKPRGHLSTNFICGILGLSFHRLTMEKIEKMAFTAMLLQIFWQNFYRNVSWVIFYQSYNFLPTAQFHLSPWKPKCKKKKKKKKNRKNTFKLISSETMFSMGLRLCRNVHHISLYRFFDSLWKLSLWFDCHGNLGFPLTYNRENWKTKFIAKQLQIFWQNFYTL